MVQYKPYPAFDSQTMFNDNAYWKLSVPDPTEPVPSSNFDSTNGDIGSIPFPALRHFVIHSRLQRGMLIYDNCRDDELRDFCQQRGLRLLRSGSTRCNMIAELERADDSGTTFARFLDLLPELRLHVYHFYQASLGDNFKPYCAAPPIMSASKLIRQEAASVFFREQMFMCSLQRDIFDSEELRRHLYLDEVTRLFFQNAPLAFLKNVRRLQVYSSLPEPKVSMFHGSGYAEWAIDLRLRTRDARVAYEGIGTFSRARQSQTEQDVFVKAVTERLRDVVDSIVTRDHLNLRREDAKTVLAALDTLPGHLAAI